MTQESNLLPEKSIKPSFWPLLGILVILLLFLLKEASSVFIPAMLALFLKLAFEPVVTFMSKTGIPRAISATLILVSLTGTIAYGVLNLTEPAVEWLEKAPEGLQALDVKTQEIQEKAKDVVAAKEKVEEMAAGFGDSASEEKAASSSALPEEVSILDAAASSLSTFAVMLVMLYFLLIAGGSPLSFSFFFIQDFAARRRVVRLARQLSKDISSYMVRIVFVNTCLGIIVAIAMAIIGLPNPLLWGFVAGGLNFIPYLGGMVTTVILLFVSLLSFDSINQALLAPALYLLLTILEGNFVTPAIHANRMTVNPALILFSVLLWYWVWGIPGVLMAVPMLAVARMALFHLRNEVFQLSSPKAVAATNQEGANNSAQLNLPLQSTR